MDTKIKANNVNLFKQMVIDRVGFDEIHHIF